MPSLTVRCSSLVVLLVALLSSSALGQDGGVELRWKFEPGRAIQVEMIQEMNMIMNVAGQKMETVNKSSNWMTWKIDSVNEDGSARVLTVIDRATSDIEVPMQGASHFDSSDPEQTNGPAGEQLEKVYRPMIGVETSTVMKPNGEITEVQIPEGSLDGLDQAGAGSVSLGKETLERLTRDASPAFPDRLAVGDSWARESEMALPGMGKLLLGTTYKYEGTEQVDGRELHRIGMDIKMEFELDSAAGDVSVEVVEQDNSGFIHFDNNTGRIESTTMNQDMTMEIQAQGQTIVQSLVQKVTTRFSENK
jgi:hypothetical protein